MISAPEYIFIINTFVSIVAVSLAFWAYKNRDDYKLYTLQEFERIQAKVVKDAGDMIELIYQKELKDFEENMKTVNAYVADNLNKIDDLKDSVSQLTKGLQEQEDLSRQIIGLRKEIREMHQEIRKRDAIIERRDKKISKLERSYV